MRPSTPETHAITVFDSATDSDVEAPLYNQLSFSSNSDASDESDESDESVEFDEQNDMIKESDEVEFEEPNASVLESSVAPEPLCAVAEISGAELSEPSRVTGQSGIAEPSGATESPEQSDAAEPKCSGIKIVGDNVDKNYHASFQRSDDTTDRSHHYFQSYLSKDRVKFSTLSDIKPPPLRTSEIDFGSLLPSAADMATIKKDMTVLLSR